MAIAIKGIVDQNGVTHSFDHEYLANNPPIPDVGGIKDSSLEGLLGIYSDVYSENITFYAGGISTDGRNYNNHPERARTTYIAVESGKTYLVHLGTNEYNMLNPWAYASNSYGEATRALSDYLFDSQTLIFTPAEGETYFRIGFKNATDDTTEITEENRTAISNALTVYTLPTTEAIESNIQTQQGAINSLRTAIDGMADYQTVPWSKFPQTSAEGYFLSWRGGYWGNSNTASNSTTDGAIRYWTWIGKQREAIGTNYVEFIPPTEGYIVLKEFESKTSTELINRYEITQRTVIRLHDTHIYRISVYGLENEISTYLNEAFINSIGIRPIYSVVGPNKAIRTGEFVRFTVKVSNYWPHETETDTEDHETGEEHDHLCILTLPETYTESGQKTPLIMYAHGASCGITDTTWYGNSTGEGAGRDFMSLVRTFTAAGYAIFDVNNTRAVSNGFYDWGSLPLMSAYVKAWEYIKEKYNVEDKLYIISASMGTPAALNMMKWYKGDIFTALILAPRPLGVKGRWDNTYGTITDERIKEFLVAWGFEPDSILTDESYEVPTKESVFTADVDAKLRGFYHHENMVTLNGTNYIFEKFPPIKVMVGTNDTGFLPEVREYFAALQNFGNCVNYREVAGQSHGAMCTLVNGDLRNEALSWFRRFRNIETDEGGDEE